MNKTLASPPTAPKEHKAFWKDVSRFALGLIALFLFNLLAQNYFFRLDLTEEKRYTINEATKEMLRNLDERLVVTIYLEGDINPSFRRLQKSIEETLVEFEVYAGAELDYRFENPLEGLDRQQQQEMMVKLNDLGIEPTRVFDEEGANRQQKLIFPGALISQGTQQAGVMLLSGDRAAGAEEALNQSIENVEYQLASGIRKLVAAEKKSVGLVQGHGELAGAEIASLAETLAEYYEMYDVFLPGLDSIPDLDVLLVNKPTEAFSKADQYKLDQYIMRGGKVMFFLDALRIEMDSLGADGSIAFPYDLGLDELLFRYGVRINKTLVQDIKSGVYPIVVGEIGGQPQIRPLQWPFFPIANRYGNHPTVKNMDAVYFRFVSEIDTVQAAGVVKTPLVYSSEYSRVLQTPMIVDLNELRTAPQPENFRAGPQALAYLLEGNFTSVFRNRVLPEMASPNSFREQSEDTKLVVVADGDFVKNDVNPQTGQPIPLGYDPITERTFANQDLVINLLSYLTDEDGLINARAKEIQIRPLDQVQVKQQAIMWQVLNLAGPVLLIMLFGVVKYYLRKRKYASN
ncbi:MAG: gliding motility-associated ABC transporter substrate-binding protein GldG [Cyclobacteriaceae bacterium]